MTEEAAGPAPWEPVGFCCCRDRRISGVALPKKQFDGVMSARPQSSLPASAQQVQDVLRTYNANLRVLQLPDSARTAKQAADAIGCTVAQIAKSLVFRQEGSGEALLVVASGTNRVSETRLGDVTGQQVVMADAETVRAVTGFAIGGVPPLAHRRPIPTLIDEDLLRFDEVWAAAGTPHSVFALDPKELPRMTGGKVVRVT